MRRSVLVVDDDDVILAVAQRMLARAGFAATMAGSVAEVLSLAAPRFEAAILDYFLDPGCGCDLIAVLRVHNPSIRIVIMSGLGFLPGLIRHAHFAGADDIVAKSELDWRTVAEVNPPPTPVQPIADLTALKREAVHGAYLVHNRNISSAARALGMNRSNLQRVLRKMPPPMPDDE